MNDDTPNPFSHGLLERVSSHMDREIVCVLIFDQQRYPDIKSAESADFAGVIGVEKESILPAYPTYLRGMRRKVPKLFDSITPLSSCNSLMIRIVSALLSYLDQNTEVFLGGMNVKKAPQQFQEMMALKTEILLNEMPCNDIDDGVVADKIFCYSLQELKA